MFSLGNNIKTLVQEFPVLKSIPERLYPAVPDEKSFSVWELANYSGLSPDFLEMLFKIYLSNELPSTKTLHKFPLGYYIHYIEQTHLYYLNRKLPQLEQHLHAITEEYSHSNLILFALCQQFQHYKKMLVEHIEEEDLKLIPHIKQLINFAEQGNFNIEKASNLLKHFRTEDFAPIHSDVESDLMRTRDLIVKYSDAREIPIAHKILLAQMEAFETDLRIHSKIEEEVILPKAIALEGVLIGFIRAHAQFPF